MMKSYIIQIFLCVVILLIDEVQSTCDVRCLKCSNDGICNEYSISNTCRSKCQNNTYRDDQSGKCVSVCPVSYYNDNNVLSCVKYPDCPNLLEKGQNHFDLIRSVGVVKNLIFVTGDKTEDDSKAKSIKVYSRENAELSGQLIEHNDAIIGILSGNYSNVEEIYSYSSTEIVQWDVKMGQKIRKALFDQKLKATTISYIDLDLIILQGEEQQFGVFLLDQIRNSNPNPVSNLFTYTNKDLNSIKGFARVKDYVYVYSLDGKLYSQLIKSPFDKKLLCNLGLPIERARAFSEKSIIMRFGKNLLAYYNGDTCATVNVGHDLVIDRILTDKDETTGNEYIFSFDQKSFRFSVVNQDTKKLDNVSSRDIKKSYSKVMKEYLITIDVSGQIIMYKYTNKSLVVVISTNLSFTTYFSISDVYIGLTSNQMYIFGTELLYLTLNLSKTDKKIDLQNRIKNIPRSLVKHTNKVNGVVFDSDFGRVITYSDDGSIIFYDQIHSTYKVVMQKYYPSTDCNMLENIRCYKGVVDLQLLRSKLYAAVYQDNSIIIWEYTYDTFNVKKTLTLTDTKATILNIFSFNDGNNVYLAYCNSKEARVYNVNTESDEVVYLPADGAKFGLLHCAVDSYNNVLYLLGTKVKDAGNLRIFNVDFNTLKNNSTNPIIPPAQIYDSAKEFYIAQYFPLQKWYMYTTSELRLYFANFPNFSTTNPVSPFIVSQNLPVSIAFDTISRDFTVFSRNQYVTFFQYANNAYNKLLTYQFASVVNGKQSTAISNPKLFFYFQNTGVSTIQNQVFVLRENLNFQMVLTFEDKISSLNVDSTNKKLYIGFENGKIYSGHYIENYLLYTSITADFLSFHYSDSTDTLFAYKKDITIIDTTKLEVTKVLTDPNQTTDLIGIKHIRETNEMIAYSSSAINLVKWNIALGTYTQFKNGHTGSVVNVLLDSSKSFMISCGSDFFFIVWNYIDMNEIYRIDDHVNSKKALDIREADVPPEYKTIFKITLFYIDIDNKVIVSANNLNQIYIHNYNYRRNINQSVTAVTNVFVDTKYRHVIASSADNFAYKLTIFEYTYNSFTKQRDISNQHTEPIKGVVIQNDNVYSFEDTKIVIMERSTLSYKQTIVCVNPLITNFIVYEKLNQVIIWSDGTVSQYLNQSIGIYHLIGGYKIIDINNNQSIEQGNIHQLLVDEDTNQLIISKTYSRNFIYTIDLKTFYYTGYYTTHYTSPLKKWQYIPRTNRLIFIDSTSPSTLSIYNMEGSINQRNNFELITDEKNKNNFMDEVNNNLYYIDAMDQSWQLNLDTNKLLLRNQYKQVKGSKLVKNNFYLVTSDRAFMFTKDFIQTGEYKFDCNQIYFTDLYLFMTNFANVLYQVDLKSFRVFASTRSLDSSIKTFISVEQQQEVILMTTGQRIYRFTTVENGTASWSYLKQDNLQNIYMDTKNSTFIIYNINQIKLQFFTYTQSVALNTLDILYTIDNLYQPFKIVFDLNQQQFIVSSISDRVPIINIYSYNLNELSAIQQPVLKKQLPSPSRSSKLQIDISDPLYIQIMLPWQIIYYDRKTYQFIKYFRDTQVIYSRQALSTIENFPNLLSSVQSDSIQFYQLQDNIFKQPSLFRFNLTYPVILNYKVIQKSIYYQIRLIGVSSLFLFEYDFQIPIQYKGVTPVFDSCYYPIDGTYNYIVRAQNGFFYHSLMKNYTSNVVYSNSNLDRPVIKLTKNLFTILGQDQVVVDNYIIDITDAETIELNPIATKFIFKSIQFIGNAKNFILKLNNLKSVIFEDILINNLSLNGNSILFDITGCDSVLIKDMRIRDLDLADSSTLFSFRDVSDLLTIDTLSITYLVLQKSFTQPYLITFVNVVKANISNTFIQDVTFVQATQIFYIISSQGVQDFIIQQTKFYRSISCSFLESKNYYKDNQQIVYLHNDQLNFQKCSFTGHYKLNSPFISIEGNSITFQKTEFFNIECQSCYGTVICLKSVLSYFYSQESYFHHTFGLQGGAIAFLNNKYVDLSIDDSSFKNCTATASGGAIYIQSSNVTVNRTIIQDCKAQIGGGIRYIGIEPHFIYLQNQQKTTKRNLQIIQNTISNNIAQIYGQNIGSYPKTIKIQTSKDLQQKDYSSGSDSDKYNLDLYELDSFQSGAEINFQFQILDQEENPIFFDLSLLNADYYPSIIQEEITKFNIKALPGNDNIKVFGQYITDFFQFNQYTKTFSIKQMLIIGDPTSTNFIQFETPSIQKIIDPGNSREFDQGPFHIKLKINFRACKRGEVYKMSGSIFYCQECKEGTYSIITPTKEEFDNQLCLRCPDQANYCYRDEMELKPGYWKYSNDTDQIVYCANKPENCEGSQLTSYCIEGHIGPQCETCDIYGNLWGKEFQSDGKLGCINCTELRQPQYLLPTIFIAIGMVIYILISIRIASQISQLIVQGYYLRQLNLLSINKSAYQDTTNMNMKAMVNYMQISSMINTFVVQLPEFMTFIPKYFGSPVENMLYTFDCYLNQASESKYPIIFLRTLWSFCIPLFYLVGVGIVYFIFIKLKIVKYNQSYIISGLVFLSFFTQPNMVSNLLGVMSCREIDGKLYISSDISFECYTKIHLTYIGIVCIPGLILWGALIPIYIFRLLIINKNKLDHALIRLKYGFLYQDFKNNRYYWEFIKMYKKLFAVAVLNFYGNPYSKQINFFQISNIITANKLVIILVVFLLYLVALLRFRPYQMKYFQTLDRNSMIVAITLLLMNIFLYNKPDQVQSQIFYVVLLFIHNSYQLYLIWQVLNAKISVQFRTKYNNFKRWIIKIFPFMKKYIVITESTKMKTFHLWMKIKYYLNEYVERKQYNEINEVKLLGSRSNSLNNQNPNQSFLPSKRNRLRIQNSQNYQPQSNTMLQQSGRQGNENNYGLSDEFSQRNFLSRDQLLSIDRLDQNYLSPKGSSNNLLIVSAKRDESQRGQYGNYLDIEDIMLSPNRNIPISLPMLNSPKLDSQNELNNYGEIEEQEDERRQIKKKGTNYDYRSYQKTDLIKKNLLPTFEDGTTKKPGLENLDEVDEKNQDTDNPNINESVTLQPDANTNPSRNIHTLAPRFQISKNTAQESDSIGFVSLKDADQDKGLIDLNDSEDEKDKNNKNEEEDEEEEDIRRMHTKQLINHNINIQKKANVVYKNLIKIECSNIFETSNQLPDQTENIIDTETEENTQKINDDQLIGKSPSLEQYDKALMNQNNTLNPNNQSQKHILSNTDLADPDQLNTNKMFSNIEQIPSSLNQNKSSNEINELLINEPVQSTLQVQQPQYLSLLKQETDLNMSKQIQDIIKNKANVQKGSNDFEASLNE